MRARTVRARLVAAAVIGWLAWPATSGGQRPPPLELFFAAASADGKVAEAALADIGRAWTNGYAAMIVDLARLMRGPRRGPAETAELPPAVDDDSDRGQPAARADRDLTAAAADRGSPSRRRLLAFLERQTRQRFGDDLNRWRTWLWDLPYEPHPDYAMFKGLV